MQIKEGAVIVAIVAPVVRRWFACRTEEGTIWLTPVEAVVITSHAYLPAAGKKPGDRFLAHDFAAFDEAGAAVSMSDDFVGFVAHVLGETEEEAIKATQLILANARG